MDRLEQWTEVGVQTAGECDGEDGTVRENAGQPRVDVVWYGTRETLGTDWGIPEYLYRASESRHVDKSGVRVPKLCLWQFSVARGKKSNAGGDKPQRGTKEGARDGSCRHLLLMCNCQIGTACFRQVRSGCDIEVHGKSSRLINRARLIRCRYPDNQSQADP